jgi:hypothetical protein
MNNLYSLQSTVADLKEIVQRNESGSTEAAEVVSQIESILADIERKTVMSGIPIVVSTTVQPVVVV